MLALDGNSQFALGNSLLVTGDAEGAKPHLEASIDLISDPGFADTVAVWEATETGDYAGGIKALHNPEMSMPAAERAAVLSGFQAIASGDKEAKLDAPSNCSLHSRATRKTSQS